MSQCWPEGELRTFLDGELPAAEMEAVEQHLAECGACRSVYDDLQTRAQRVSEMLVDLDSVPLPAAPPALGRPRIAWKPVAAALALAALIAFLFVLSPKPVQAPAPAVTATAPAPEPALPVITVAEAPRPPVARHRAFPRRRSVQYYVAFDEEPIDTGMVMRVALASGQQADVIVDTAGRPRAIRPVQ